MQGLENTYDIENILKQITGLGNLKRDIRMEFSKSEENHELAKKTGGWFGGYDYSKSNMIQSNNGHYSDKGKLPWHRTFSNESSYSTPEFQGGLWENKNGKMSFTPSKDMIDAGLTKGLKEYMENFEPGVELKAPNGYNIDSFK